MAASVRKVKPVVRKVNTSPPPMDNFVKLKTPDLTAPPGTIFSLDCYAHVSHFLRQNLIPQDQNPNFVRSNPVTNEQRAEHFAPPKGTRLTLDCENHVTHCLPPQKTSVD